MEDSSEPPIDSNELAHRLKVVEYKLEKALLILCAMGEKQGIEISAIPGMDRPPPTRRSLSPSMHSPSQSASPSPSSPQVGGMSSLNISDTQSNASVPSGMCILCMAYI
jgi:hypothetical protein